VAQDFYRSWLIEQDSNEEYVASHPDYDGPLDDRHVAAKTRDAIIEEIDAWIWATEETA